MKFNITDKSITSYEDKETLHIVGIANTGREDLYGDVLTRDALMNICEQAVNHNLHLDHDTSMEGLLGPITSARLVPEGVEIHAEIVNKEHATRIKTLLEAGVKLGMSVSGVATNTSIDKHTITDWDLTEISLTPLPCDQGTMGSVVIAKSFAEVIKKTITEEDKPRTEDKDMAEEVVTIEKVIELINDAFNERREEYLETIREELKTEYDAQLKEIQERLDTLTKEKEEEDDAVVSNPAGEKPVDEDVNAQLEQMEAETEEGAVAEQKATQTEEEKEGASEEEDEDDDEKEDIVKSIESIINKKFDEIFTNKKHADLDFKYKEEEQKAVESERVVKKSYTPHELAQLLSRQ